MRIPTLACLSLVLLFGRVPLAFAQDEAPPDYSKTPLKKWLEALNDDSNDLNPHAARALGPDGPYAARAVPALIEVLGEKGPSAFLSPAASVLGDYGPAILPELLEAAKRPDRGIRSGALEALIYVRPKSPVALEALIGASKDSDAAVREMASYGLGKLRMNPDRAVHVLIAALSDKDEKVQDTTASALGAYGPKAAPAVRALVVSLRTEAVRYSAAKALGSIGPAAKDAVPKLIEAVRGKPESYVQAIIVEALGKIGPAAFEAVPTLIEAIHNKDDRVRQNAIQALGEIGPPAKSAVSALMERAQIEKEPEQWLAIRALGKIGPDAKAAVPVLIEMLKKKPNSAIATTLANIGPAARQAVPILAAIARNTFEATSGGYASAREAAASAVMKLDPDYGTKHEIEFSFLDFRLGPLAPIKLTPREAVSPDRKVKISKLIAELAQVRDPDYGMSSTLSGHAFAPLPERGHFSGGILTDHRLKSANAFRQLVEIGPDALPFLLDALDNPTRTKLNVGNGYLGSGIDYHRLNPLEQRVVSVEPVRSDDDDDGISVASDYQIRIGDVCFVAIGQIVGRQYSAVHYQPTAMVFINSPVQSKVLRDRVRAIWFSTNPAERLLQSYLIDFATEGKRGAKDYRGRQEASRRQIEAAVRLLYYFPKESTGVIAERLNRFDVKRPLNDHGRKRDINNGVDTEDFLKAVNWCKEPAIRDVLFDISQRTNDLQILLAVLPSVNQTRPDSVISRLRTDIGKLPVSEERANGDGHQLLEALAEYAGDKAKPDFKAYLRDASLQRRFTMCWVLEEVKQEWALEFLTPMLTDKRTGYARKDWRLCDSAASALRSIHRDLNFHRDGTPEERDRSIEQMRQQIARKKK